MKAWTLAACASLVTGCVSSHPDHFYVLESGRTAPLTSSSHFTTQVHLRVDLPELVDRPELVLQGSGSVIPLEHERWAAPLSEQFVSVLGQDLEARRPDIIVTSRNIAESQGAMAKIAVDVVSLSLQKTAGATIEVRWRVQRDADTLQGRESFAARSADGSYAALIRSLNVCVGLLADRLAEQLPKSQSQ